MIVRAVVNDRVSERKRNKKKLRKIVNETPSVNEKRERESYRTGY